MTNGQGHRSSEADRQSSTVIREIDAELSGVLAGEIRTDAYTRHLYASDASMYSIEPLAVAFPRHVDDVVATVKMAQRLQVPVLARGAGTSLAGQTVAQAVILDFSRHMNAILEVDTQERIARVQPGVIQDQLNEAVRPASLMFGPDTSTSNRATIGGMIGNNSAGSHSIRYGSTIDHVEALETVLSDSSLARFAPTAPRDTQGNALSQRLHRGVSEILDRYAAVLEGFPPVARHSGGYRLDRARDTQGLALHKLLVGSEGTLAVVTEATVRLVPRPPARAIAVGHFASTADAVAATQTALALDPDSVELMDRTILELSRQRMEYAELSGLLEGDPAALLFVEFAGQDIAAVTSQADRLSREWTHNGHGYYTLHAATARQQAAVLKVRKAGLGLLMAASQQTLRPLAFVEDTAVPPDVLASYVEDFAAVLERHSLTAGFYGHCSVGCLHIRPFVDLAKPGQADLMRAVAREIADLAKAYGGVNSSEHGDGLARSEFNSSLFGADLYQAMRDVKHLFDPDDILNPGKIVDAPHMTENLRDAAQASSSPELLRITPKRSFAAEGGILAAADRCMNIGACRKESGGVMCPSYMATRNEHHSTRGRANALVKALSSPNPLAELSGEPVHEILDLCLECKACKSECPLGVDMAALKSEVLFQRHQIVGTPLRSRLFGSIRLLNRLGAATAPVSNWVVRLRPVRLILERFLGLSRNRILPTFHRHTVLSDQRARIRQDMPEAPKGDIVLLADSFTTYSEPAIGRAAVELLQAAGWRVHLTGNLCCGRARFSKGLLDKAQRDAAAMVDHLAPYALRGVPIVGLEPSCLLTLKDEYPAMLPEDERVAAIASHARLLPEVLGESVDDGSLELDPESDLAGQRIVFHGHCHEKALVGTAATRALLERIPGAEVHELDAGCCGMAGSFGYEVEHYEMSMQIGNLSLFPALANEDQHAIVAASGTSCRQQIEHGSGRRTSHPVELLRTAMRSQ